MQWASGFGGASLALCSSRRRCRVVGPPRRAGNSWAFHDRVVAGQGHGDGARPARPSCAAPSEVPEPKRRADAGAPFSAGAACFCALFSSLCRLRVLLSSFSARRNARARALPRRSPPARMGGPARWPSVDVASSVADWSQSLSLAMGWTAPVLGLWRLLQRQGQTARPWRGLAALLGGLHQGSPGHAGPAASAGRGQRPIEICCVKCIPAGARRVSTWAEEPRFQNKNHGCGIVLDTRALAIIAHQRPFWGVP